MNLDDIEDLNAVFDGEPLNEQVLLKQYLYDVESALRYAPNTVEYEYFSFRAHAYRIYKASIFRISSNRAPDGNLCYEVTPPSSDG